MDVPLRPMLKSIECEGVHASLAPPVGGIPPVPTPELFGGAFQKRGADASGDCVREVRGRRTPLEGEQQTLEATPTDRITVVALRRAAHRARLARVTPDLAAFTGRP